MSAYDNTISKDDAAEMQEELLSEIAEHDVVCPVIHPGKNAEDDT